MATIAENLQRIQDAKADIAAAIVEKGGSVSGLIDTFAEAIRNLPSSGGLTYEEGDVTATSASQFITVNHNLGNVPVFAYLVGKMEDYTGITSTACVMNFMRNGAILGVAIRGNMTSGYLVFPVMDASKVTFRAYSSSEAFLGEYHYVIIAKQ